MLPLFRRAILIAGALAIFTGTFVACHVLGFAVLTALYPAFGLSVRVPVGGSYPAAPLGIPLLIDGGAVVVALLLASVCAILLQRRVTIVTRPPAETAAASTDDLWP